MQCTLVWTQHVGAVVSHHALWSTYGATESYHEICESSIMHFHVNPVVARVHAHAPAFHCCLCAQAVAVVQRAMRGQAPESGTAELGFAAPLPANERRE
jgi:hypothetical protein